MNAIEKITPTAFVRCGLLLLFVGLQELLLLVRVSFEEEARDLVKGATHAFEQFPHAAEREPSPEGFLDPLTGLGRRLEASGGDLAFEVVELRRFQSAQVAFIVEPTKGLQSAALVEFQPVAHRAATDAKELTDVLGRASFIPPEQGGETVVDARVFLLASEFFDLFAE